MVLRCSLLGHDFGEPDVEREREERGSEVVVTVQEYEECSRCGEKHVVSENTEVTSLTTETDADALPDDPDPDVSTLETDTAETDTAQSDETADAEIIDDEAEIIDADAEIIDADAPAGATADAGDTGPADADDSETEPSTAVTADPDDELDLPTDENGNPVTDDGEILEDGREPDRDRDHGEWPDSDDVGPPIGAESEPAEWPDTDEDELGSDTGYGDLDPDEPVDDAIVLENDSPSGSADVDATADVSAAAATDARSVTAEPVAEGHASADTDSTSGPDTGIERAQSAPTPTESASTSDTDVPTEFYCPRCDFVADGNGGSLRAGDICPECRKGYLSERER
ncbi:DUF7093 family protein [Natrinema caseinilyticum]|uniref:DUF7093 family protein n=1 Tax=Natrinema caseinilyticum TaxID=2961570 RepID=UPI0020C20427|nr:hypothetical protein [Natrinema caseinilyticum]